MNTQFATINTLLQQNAIISIINTARLNRHDGCPNTTNTMLSRVETSFNNI